MKILLILFATFFSTASHACMVPISFEEKVRNSDIIFSGKLVETKCENQELIMHFEPQKFWKGEKEEELSIKWDRCPKEPFAKSADYLVYANIEENKMALGPHFFCESSILRIRPRWLEWLVFQKFLWEMGSWPDFNDYGSIHDTIKKLNEYNFSDTPKEQS